MIAGRQVKGNRTQLQRLGYYHTGMICHGIVLVWVKLSEILKVLRN
jgi:hypothetical protein